MSFHFEEARREAVQELLHVSTFDRHNTDNFDRFAYYAGLPKQKQEDDGRFLIVHKDEPAERKPDVSQKTIDGYIESFENLKKNGVANQETLDSFKEVVKSLPKLDQKGLQAALKKAAGNEKVDMPLVVQHVREILQSSGFSKRIDGGAALTKTEGGFIVKNPDNETYVQLQYKKEKSGATVDVSIERKGEK
ncbi:MAG: hypothetical protein U0105_12545 [Candidatus Obscuribacterales bacterium]